MSSEDSAAPATATTIITSLAINHRALSQKDLNALFSQPHMASITRMIMTTNKFERSAHFRASQLPRGLERFSLNRPDNLRPSRIDLRDLPKTLEWLDISDTDLEKPSQTLTSNGSLDVLLPNLRVLDLAHNCLSSLVDLTKLPANLEKLDVSYNKLSGTCPNLTRLPSGLKLLNMAGNQLNGTPHLTRLPRSLRRLFLQRNLFSGEFPDLSALPETLERFDMSRCKYVGGPILAKFPADMDFLDISHNKMTVTPVFVAVAPTTAAEQQQEQEQQGEQEQKPRPLLTAQDAALATGMLGRRDIVMIQKKGKMAAASGNREDADNTPLPTLPSSAGNNSNNNNNYHGVIIRRLDLCWNRFETSPDLFTLPTTIEWLNLSNNKITKLPSFENIASHLPSLVYLDFSKNNLKGELPLLFSATTNDNGDDDDGGGDSCRPRRCLHLPDSLRFLDLSQNELTGGSTTLDLTSLPKSLLHLDLSKNAIAARANLTKLPPRMEHLDLSENKFFGSVSLKSLPWTLERLYLQSNSFMGDVDISRLPQELHRLDLSCNEFTGSTIASSQLAHLPPLLDEVNLSNNGLSGGFVMSKVPESLEKLNLSHNKLSAVDFSCDSSSAATATTDGSKSNSTKSSLKRLMLSDNCISGSTSVDFEAIAKFVRLVTLDLANNQLSGHLEFSHLGGKDVPFGMHFINLSGAGNTFSNILPEQRGTSLSNEFYTVAV